MATRIGFVILTWNSEQTVGSCLESVLALSGVESTAIVSDNGSADGTTEVVSGFERRFPDRIRLVRNGRNLGTTVPRNRAISEFLKCGTDFICVLDSDTVVNDEAICALSDHLSAHADCGVVGPALVSPDGKTQLSARNFPTLGEKLLKATHVKGLERLAERAETVDGSGLVDYLLSACWMVNPAVFRKAGLLDERIFYAPEDAEFCLRVWKAGFKVAYVPAVSIIHVWQRIGRRRFLSRHNFEHVRGLFRMFARHGYLWSRKGLRG